MTHPTQYRSFRRWKVRSLFVDVEQLIRLMLLCPVLSNIVDSLNVSELASDFAKRSDIRTGLFGVFYM